MNDVFLTDMNVFPKENIFSMFCGKPIISYSFM